MASSNEVSWQSAFLALVPLALNSMSQLAGRTCGLDASLRIYLRSSPIVCAIDTVFIFIRFALYTRHDHSVLWPARKIIAARGLIDKDPNPEDAVDEDPKPGQLLSLETNIYLFYLVLGVVAITQFIKIIFCSGVPWTQVWACFYAFSFFVVDVTNRLGKAQKYTKSKPAEDDTLKQQESSIDFWEKFFGVVAIILQLAILASVDLKAIPPDPVLIVRWTSICLRFGAHFSVVLIHLPFMAFKIDAAEPSPEHHGGFLLMSIIVPHIIVACTQKHRFTQLYFMVSVNISYFSWMLYFFPATKKYVLFSEPGNRWRRNVQVFDSFRNVLAFDFFCRILCFSVFWYAVHYNPTGTVKPPWTNYLG
jgi:hypothetical protein